MATLNWRVFRFTERVNQVQIICKLFVHALSVISALHAPRISRLLEKKFELLVQLDIATSVARAQH